MSYLFVINPNARHGKPEALKQILENKILENKEYRSHKHEFIITTSIKEVEHKMMEKIEKENVSTVVAVGGDGTIATIMYYIMKHPKIHLGIIPQGTGNLLASNLGIPKNIDSCLKTIFEGEIKSIDLGLVNNKPFTIMTGIGLVANIIESIKREEKSLFGFWIYLIKGLQELYSTKEYSFQINIDGNEINTKSTSVFVSNARNFLGPFRTVTPEADPTDGYLNLFIALPKSLKKEPLKHLKYLINYLTNNLNSKEFFEEYKGKHITINSNPPLKVQADGCIISETPLKIEILPHRLKVLVPKKTY